MPKRWYADYERGRPGYPAEAIDFAGLPSSGTASGTARTYYLAPALTIAVAAAGRAVEWLSERPSLRWVPAAATALLVLAFATGAPMSIPLLPPERYVAYERALGISPPPEDRGEPSALPLHFALRFHGPPLLSAIAAAYESLPPDDREHVVILTDSFHEAGAVGVMPHQTPMVCFSA
jgi:hypothetical protein